MGILFGILDAVGSFISGVVNAIGPVIAGFAKEAFNIISKISIPGLNIFSIVSIAAKIIHDVIEFLNIKSEDDPEILGAKAEQSDKNLEDFDNDVEKYIQYLRDEVKLDKEKFEKFTPEERLGCKAVGMALETKAIEEKIGGIEISPECLATITKIKAAGIDINAKELVEIIKALKSAGITNINDVSEFLDGKGSSDRLKTGEILTDILGDDSNGMIIKLQDAVRSFEEE